MKYTNPVDGNSFRLRIQLSLS